MGRAVRSFGKFCSKMLTDNRIKINLTPLMVVMLLLFHSFVTTKTGYPEFNDDVSLPRVHRVEI